MIALTVKLNFFNPVTNQNYDGVNNISVRFIKKDQNNSNAVTDSKQFNFDTVSKTFSINFEEIITNSHQIRVFFENPNFSVSKNKWLSKDEVEYSDLPVLIPGVLPNFDTITAWNFAAKKAENIFSGSLISRESSAVNPFILNIPLREIFNIGHRGAPDVFPENTISSFKEALKLGANGFEFDLCLTKDNQIVVFHDAKPVAISKDKDRRNFESLKYKLASPIFKEFNNTRYYSWLEFRNGKFEESNPVQMQNPNSLDIINLTADEVRKYYKYNLVNNSELHEIVNIDTFLEFVQSETDKLRLLFFDIKYTNATGDEAAMSRLGTVLGYSLKKFPNLPKYLVVCSPQIPYLKSLKKAIEATGENRCVFAYDAAGGFDAILGLKDENLGTIPKIFRWFTDLFTPTKYDPLKVAREMGNKVVSIGTLLRPGGTKEISDAVYDRDYNIDSPVEVVLHWTLNEPKQLTNSFNLGVNGILTDYPEKLQHELDLLNIRIVSGKKSNSNDIV